MRENENLEEIFDRYVGLELLGPDWRPSPSRSGSNYTNLRTGRSSFSRMPREQRPAVLQATYVTAGR